LSTSVLLVCGALASIHVLVHLATVAMLTVLAPTSPPLYGLVACVHGVMPFLARRLTRAPGSATITAGIAGVMVAASSPSGIILLVPLLLTGVVIDAVVWRVDHGGIDGRRVEVRFYVAGIVLGAVLFAVSLSVFSPEHLTPVLVLGTMAARIAGEVIAVAVTGVLARALRRAGVGDRARGSAFRR
jgi:hypothetical protein